MGQGGGAGLRGEDQQGDRAARGHAHVRLRRRDRRHHRRGGVRATSTARSCASPRRTPRCRSRRRWRRRSCPRWTTCSPRSKSCPPTDDPEELISHGHRNPRRRRHAADGRERVRGHDHALGEGRSATPIEADETIVEISTDKVDTEVPSPASGVVRELLADEGETVPVNTRIAVIDTGGSGADARRSEAPATPPRRPPSDGGARGRACRAGGRGPPAPAPAAPEAPPVRRATTEIGEGRSFVSPVVARMLAEHDLDISADPRHRPRRPRDEEGRAGSSSTAGGTPRAAPAAQRRPRCTTSRTSRPSLEDAIVEPAPTPRRPHRHRPRPPPRGRAAGRRRSAEPSRPPGQARPPARSSTASRPSAR